jgi:hypothetical protein
LRIASLPIPDFRHVLALALAAKDSIANFFGTLTILFDKPFQVGERIVIDNYGGVVENVGFRSCQISNWTPISITRSAGRRKNEVASAELRDINMKRLARQCAMLDGSAMTRFPRPM